MAHVRWAGSLQRVLVEDVRANNTFMRITLHEDARVIVVRHWNGDVCVAATRIPVSAAPDLISLLVAALAPSEETVQPELDAG